MLKRNLNLNFLFSKADALSDPTIQNWVKELTYGSITPKPNWESDYPDPEIELSLDHVTVDRLCAVYLLDDEKPQSIAGAMLVSNCGHELETLSQLFVNEEIQEFEYEPAPTQIGSWNNLGSYTAPCTDILISDRYIMSRESLLTRNLYQIIKTLVRRTHDLSINIVIFVEHNSIDSNIDLDRVSDIIKESVEGIVGKEPNVTFVLCPHHPGQPVFHDRLILTNYRAITSGDSFNYFNEQGHVRTTGYGITISSLAKRCNYVQEKVIDTYCKQLKKELTGATVLGDKKSNFLKFS